MVVFFQNASSSSSSSSSHRVERGGGGCARATWCSSSIALVRGRHARTSPFLFCEERRKKRGEKSEHILRYSVCDCKGHDAHEAKSSPGRRRRRRTRRRNHREGVEDDENDIPSNSRGLSVFSSFLFRFRGTIIFNCVHVKKKSPIKELKIATKNTTET